MLAEGLLSPAIPSVAARAGGIFFPLAKALCLACGSDPEKGTEDQMGAYVMKVQTYPPFPSPPLCLGGLKCQLLRFYSTFSRAASSLHLGCNMNITNRVCQFLTLLPLPREETIYVRTSIVYSGRYTRKGNYKLQIVYSCFVSCYE